MRMRPEASAGSKDIWLAKTTAGNSGDRSDNLRNHCESAPPGNHREAARPPCPFISRLSSQRATRTDAYSTLERSNGAFELAQKPCKSSRNAPAAAGRGNIGNQSEKWPRHSRAGRPLQKPCKTSKNAPAAAERVPLGGYFSGRLPGPRGADAFYSAPAAVRGCTRQRAAPALTLADLASAFGFRALFSTSGPNRPVRNRKASIMVPGKP